MPGRTPSSNVGWILRLDRVDAGRRVVRSRDLSGGGTGLDWVVADARAVDTQLHLVLHRLTLVDLQTMLLVHAVLIAACTALALARRRWTAAAAWLAVAVCSVAWLAVDQHWEGRILYRLGGTHGVTEADLVVPAAIAVALLVRGLRRLGRASARRRGERREAGVPSVFRTMWPKYD